VTASPTEVADALSAAENRHDLSDLERWVWDDLVMERPGAEPVLGVDGYRSLMEAWFRALPDYRSVLDRQIVQGGCVARHWRITGTHIGELAGIAPTGRSLELAGATFLDIVGGRCRRIWVLVDRASLRAQLVEPAADPPGAGSGR
jgi:predicted ester cyclase